MSKIADEYVTAIHLPCGRVALIDSVDDDRVRQYKWKASTDKRGRVFVKTGTGFTLHRLIMGAVIGQQVEHINGDGLDNRRVNLRLRGVGDGSRKGRRRKGELTSSYKGVTKGKGKARPYVAQVCYRGRTRFLGSFEHEADAARAYDEFARKNFGPGTTLNFPDDAYSSGECHSAD